MEMVKQNPVGFDIGATIKNAMATKYNAAQTKRAEAQETRAVAGEARAVAEEGRKDTKFNWEKVNQQTAKTMNGLTAALKAKSPEQAKAWYKAVDPDTDVENMTFAFAGEDVVISTPEWELEGPKAQIEEISAEIAKDPTLISDPARRMQMTGYMASKGVNYKVKEAPAYQPKTKEEAIKFYKEKAGITTREAAKRKEPVKGDIQYYGAQEDGKDMTIYERWNGDEWERAGAVGKFKDGSTEKVPPEVNKAQQLVLKFAKGQDPNMIMAMSFMDDDRFEKLEKKGLLSAGGVPENLKDEYAAALKILKAYYAAKTPGAAPATTAKPTHTFTREGGFVANEP